MRFLRHWKWLVAVIFVATASFLTYYFWDTLTTWYMDIAVYTTSLSGWVWWTAIAIAAVLGLIVVGLIANKLWPGSSGRVAQFLRHSGTRFVLSFTRELVILAGLIALGLYVSWIPHLVLAGFLASLLGFGLTVPFFKDTFEHDPNKPEKPAFLVRVGYGRSVVIEREGDPLYVIHGDQRLPNFSLALFGVWYLFKVYVKAVTGMFPYVPYFTEPKSYDLPRYDMEEQDGKPVYWAVEENSGRYRSNHVRTTPETWYFEYSGAEIQKIPFLVKGSALYRIDETKVIDSLYTLQTWNVLLNIALASVVRSVVRGEVTLDMVIGEVPQDIWATVSKANNPYKKVAPLILKEVKEYKFEGEAGDEFADKTLADVGILVYRIDIVDFQDELEDEERAKLLAAVLGREEGRARSMIGQGTAEAQKKLVDAHGDGTGASGEIIKSDALVRAASGKGGILDALAASFTRNQMKG